MEHTYRDVIYLSACALHGEKPDKERIRQMNLYKMYQTAKYHTMTAICYMGLELVIGGVR